MSRQRGFSIIELLMVVAIILIIASIAIPNLLRSKIAANEASAAATLTQIATANAVYLTLYGQGFAGTLAQLGPTGPSCASVSSGCSDLLDSLISGVSPSTPTPAKSGYRFTYYPANASPTPPNPNTSFSVVAVPLAPGTTGSSTFCIDHYKNVRKDPTGGVTTASSAGCGSSWP